MPSTNWHGEDGALTGTRAPAGDADAPPARPPAIAAAIYGGLPLADLKAAHALRIRGDRTIIERFVTFFPLPAEIAAAKKGTVVPSPF